MTMPTHLHYSDARILLITLLTASLPIGSLTGCRSIRQRTAKENKLVSARELTRSGCEAMQCEQWREAEVKFERALREHPSDPTTRRHYARTLWNRGARDEAIDHQRRAVELAGGDAGWLAELGRMQLAEKREEEAMACADQALAIDRHLAAGWYLKASLLRQQGQLEEALASYHRALTLEPDLAELRLELAEFYRELGRPRRALSMLQRLAGQYAPGELPANILYLQGLAFTALNRHSEAIRVFAEAADKEPATDTIYELAQAHFRAGRTDEARQVAHEGIANNGEAPQLIALLHYMEDAPRSPSFDTSGSSHPHNSDNRKPVAKEQP